MSDIKYIIFDIGDVLVKRGGVDFTDFDEKFGLNKGVVQKMVDDCFQKSTSNSDFNVEEYYKKKYSDILPYEKYEEVINAIFNSEELNQDLVDWIDENQDKYNFAVLSNNFSNLELILENKFNIGHLFSKVFNSAEIGVKKPDPGVFEAMLNNLPTSSKECLFVDNKKENTESAKKLGLNIIQYKNFDAFVDSFRKLVR